MYRLYLTHQQNDIVIRHTMIMYERTVLKTINGLLMVSKEKKKKKIVKNAPKKTTVVKLTSEEALHGCYKWGAKKKEEEFQRPSTYDRPLVAVLEPTSYVVSMRINYGCRIG